MVAYSILYNGRKEGDDSYAQFAVDWNWQIAGQWARSEKDSVGHQWWPQKGLDDKSYRAILTHFGLENYIQEFPLGKIVSMSPAELANARREKEKLYKLELKIILSDTLGNHLPAEKYV